MSDLIKALEEAEKGGRELDALVSVALKLDCKPNLTDDLHSLRPIRKDDHCAPGTYWFVQRSGMSLRTSEPVTTSVDHALALASRVLTMGAWDVGYAYNCDRPYYARLVVVRDDEGQPEVYGRSSTPALALCAAILKAASDEGAGR